MLNHKNLLRNEVRKEELKRDATNKHITNPQKTFSLARVQIAIWTIIIIFSYLYVYFCKGSCGNMKTELNHTALMLMGISLSTVAIANTIDNSQQNNHRHQNVPSKGFIIDILSDENGISIHRFQVILFTIVAIVIYINKLICDKCTLPELDNTLLAIITASYSGYLVIKINENKKTNRTNIL